jgi:hypothetical protein
MLVIIISGVALAAIGSAGVYVGLKLAGALREQFDELMPQRMIDYSGFVTLEPRKD